LALIRTGVPALPKLAPETAERRQGLPRRSSLRKPPSEGVV